MLFASWFTYRYSSAQMTCAPIESAENLDVHLLTLYFECATIVGRGLAGQTHLVMGFDNFTASRSLVTEPHISLLTSCWFRL